MRYRLSAVGVVLLGALPAGLFASPVSAGIPVVDTGNLTQSTVSAIEETAQTAGQATMIGKQAAQYAKQLEQFAKQVEQFETQLEQYGLQEDEFDVQQNQYGLQQDQYDLELLNTEAPEQFIWDQAQTTVGGLIETIDTLSYYQNSLGSIDAYLRQFRDVSYYKSSPCFSEEGCSDSEMSAISENEEMSSESQKKANDALFKGLAKQQANLEADAQNLVRLQAAAQDAQGRLAVLQYANQFASQQISQLMQIRGLLMAQQNALAAEMHAQANRRAQEQASSVRLRKGGFQVSPSRSW